MFLTRLHFFSLKRCFLFVAVGAFLFEEGAFLNSVFFFFLSFLIEGVLFEEVFFIFEEGAFYGGCSCF